MSDDCISGNSNTGNYLFGVNLSNTLRASSVLPENLKTCIRILGKKDFRLGGQFGSEFVEGNVCMVVPYDSQELTYMVTFDTDGGSEVPSQTVAYGGLAIEPTAPTKDGYTFDNWYKDAELTTLFDFMTETITANTTIYAKWN